MKKWILIVAMFFCKFGIGQNTTIITYTRKIVDDLTINGWHPTHIFTSKLIFNDSASLYYFVPLDSRDKNRKKTVLGDKLIHHALFYSKNNDELLNEVAWPKENYFIVIDSPKTYNWVFNGNTKKVCGYDCNLAFSVDKKNDTTLVWYSTQVGKLFGPNYYFGLPGVVLEVFDQKNAIHLSAIKIENKNITLLKPDETITRYQLKDYLANIKKFKNICGCISSD